MARRGRPPILDAEKQDQILAIITLGCSQRTAADCVGCSPRTIWYTAERNEAFAEKLEQAKGMAVVKYMKNIHIASQKGQYWRAAAWALERLRPEEYAAKNADAITPEQVSQVIGFLSRIVIEEVPIAEYRKKIMKRLKQISNMVKDLSSEQRVENKVKVEVIEKE